jgi:hypothetical protein
MTFRAPIQYAACLVLGCAVAACTGPPRPEIAVYSKRAFRGEAVTLREPYADLGVWDLDNAIRSLRPVED